MKWTRAQRYQTPDQIPDYLMKALQDKVARSLWRFDYHIQPPTGLLNDPNGLCYANGLYHLFYQWFPLGAVHGLKHWYHLTSSDLVDWEFNSHQIHPDTLFDSHGAYSGSALVEQGEIFLFYTGNVRDQDWKRTAYQVMAQLTDQGIKKHLPAVIMGQAAGYTDHFRDPKVWKYQDKYYMILGAQRKLDLNGCALIYTSNNKYDWALQGELNAEIGSFGYMWECPDLFRLNGEDFFLFCPQGVHKEKHNDNKHNDNIYLSGYIHGQFNYQTLAFTQNLPHFQKLDHGFDFYAPQTFLDEYGQRILIGWMGLPDLDYPSDKDGWAHALGLPRVLSYDNGRLYQRPINALEQLRKHETIVEDQLDYWNLSNGASRGYQLLITFLEDASNLSIHLYKSGDEMLILSYQADTKTLILDRSHFKARFGVDFGETRTVYLAEGLQSINCFRDTSSIEIFINDGAYVMSARFFPKTIVADLCISCDQKTHMIIKLYALDKKTG